MSFLQGKLISEPERVFQALVLPIILAIQQVYYPVLGTFFSFIHTFIAEYFRVKNTLRKDSNHNTATTMRLLLFVLTFFLFIPGFSQTQYVLIEEGTGTWCQWCPRGMVFGHDLNVNNPQVIMVAVHQGDDMEITGYPTFLAHSGYPNGHFNRVGLNIDPSDWIASLPPYLTPTPPASVDVSVNFNSSNRDLDITVTADFTTTLSGNYRLGAIVIEDHVTGPSPGYDQSNSYSGGGNGPMGGFESLPNPVPANLMVYDHVARALPGGFEGDANSLPTTIPVGQQSYSYTTNIPANWNEDNIHVVGFLLEESSGTIINAGKSTLLDGSTNVQPFIYSTPVEDGFVSQTYTYPLLGHDADDDNLTLTISGSLPSWLNFTDNGHGEGLFSGTPTAPGSYPVEVMISDGNSSSSQSFTIEVQDVTGVGWILVGDEGYTNQTVTYHSAIDVAPDGTVYTAHANGNTDQLYVWKYENEQWSQVGNALPTSPLYFDITVDSDGTPYVATSDNFLQVFKWENNTWSQIGGNVKNDARYIHLHVDDSGVPHVGYTGGSGAGEPFVSRYVNGTWEDLGGGAIPLAGNYGLWPYTAFGPNGNIAVSYADGPQGAWLTYVSEWDGSSWNALGSGPIDQAHTVYFDQALAYDGNGNLHCAYISGNSTNLLRAYSWDGNSWNLEGADLAGGASQWPDMVTASDGTVYLAFLDGAQGNGASVLKNDGNGWIFEGLRSFSGAIESHGLAVDQNNIPYVVYGDVANGQQLSVRRYAALNTSAPSEASTQNELHVFPNPSEGQFTLISEKGGNYTILDIQGRIAQTGTLREGTNQHIIQTSGLPNGLYFFQLESSGKIQTEKLIISK